jgi:hypothetical protein
MQASIAAKQRKMDQEEKAQAHKDAQTSLRIQLGKLGAEDPETYNRLIDDPAIAEFLSPKHVEEIRRRGESPFEKYVTGRREKKAAAAAEDKVATAQALSQVGLPSMDPESGAVPVPMKPRAPTSLSGLPPITGAPLEAARLAREADIAGSRTKIDVSEFQGLLAKMNKGDLSSDDVVKQLAARFGKLPTGEELAVQGGQITGATTAAATPGTLAYKQTEARKIFDAQVDKSAITDPSDLARLQNYSQYLVGLTDQVPEKLPERLSQTQLKMEQKAQELREKMFSFDKVKYETDKRQMTLQAGNAMVNSGVDPAIAFKFADEYLRTGKLPEGIVLAPDKEQQLKLQVADLQVQKLQAEIEKLRADDPQVDLILKTLQQYPTSRTAMEGHTKYDSPAFQALKAKLKARGIELPSTVPPTMFDKFLGAATFGLYTPQSSEVGEVKFTTPGVTSAGTAAGAPAPETGAAAIWTPEIDAAFTKSVQDAAAFMPQLDPAGKAQMQEKLKALQTASGSKDPVATAKAVSELTQLMTLLGKK